MVTFNLTEECASKLKVIGINVFSPGRQRRGVFIAGDYPNLANSEGATYSYPYVAPSEFAMNIIIQAINIGLLRSQSEITDNK
jgi:hypothetical protein